MNDDSIKLNPNNALISCLELLVKIYARQDALTKLLVDNLSKNDKHKKEMLESFNEDYLSAEKRLMNLLYEDFGELDIKGLFEDDYKK